MAGLHDHVASWHPQPVDRDDELDPAPVAALSATLDLPPVARRGEALPPLWHWLHFLDWPPQGELGPDGHPAHGHFLPPIPDRRRMIAGGRLDLHAPLLLGTPARRRSSLSSVEVKQGRTGELVFVTVKHEISQDARLCAVEEQDVVYRSGEDDRLAATLGFDPAEVRAPGTPWALSLRPDPPMLFRFSALTANAHRIHYDPPYARDVEGYPGLVVHGPLLVLLMLDLARREAPAREPRSVSFRLRKPVFEGEHVLVLGDPGDEGADLRVATARDDRHATAQVRFR